MTRWWIHKPYLLGCANPTEECLNELHERGFRAIISLLEEEEETPLYNSRWIAAHGWTKWNIPIRDFTAPAVTQIWKLLNLLKTVSAGVGVVMHCQGGSGRTGTMAAAYWIARGDSAADAIARVKRENPQAVEEDEQEEVLTEFERCVRGEPKWEQ